MTATMERPASASGSTAPRPRAIELPADLDVRRVLATFPHYLPLLRMRRASGLRTLLVGSGARLPSDQWQRTPLVIVGGDDDGAERLGPGGYPCADRLVRSANAVMIHAAGGLPEHYELAAAAALLSGRALVVETCTARQEEWVAFVRTRSSAPPLLIAVPPGRGVHPTRPPLQ